MPVETIRSNALSRWNEFGLLAMADWLATSQSSRDRQRLRCVGNIVMPACARLALHVMTHLGAHRDKELQDPC